MVIIAALSVALAAGAPLDTGEVALQQQVDTSALGSETLAAGRSEEAIAVLEASDKDPAQMINLGIAYALEGDEDQARAMFEAALFDPNPIELETADGDKTDSRRLARKALRMLAAGDFSPRSNSRVTLRD